MLPGGSLHFHWARSGEYVTRVTATGPLGLEYLGPEDDPRKQLSHFRGDVPVTREPAAEQPTMIIAGMQTFPLRIPFKTGNRFAGLRVGPRTWPRSTF